MKTARSIARGAVFVVGGVVLGAALYVAFVGLVGLAVLSVDD